MFKKIDHVEIITDDLERSVDFYTTVLGFTPKRRQHIERSTLGVPLDVVLLDLGGTAVELLSYRGATVAPSPTGEQLGYRMMALEVEDMDRALADLKTKGIEPSWGPRVTEGQDCRAEIRDPHGHRIELRQWFSPVGARGDRSPREETR
jgi:catechol 2,3-dioxygenase-like lactoylglutathione lyase family enzyme